MINIIIPMAGLGSRFSKNGIKTPKPLIRVDGKTLIEHSVESFEYNGSDCEANTIYVKSNLL